MARSVRADSIKVYLSAIRYMHIVNGYNLDLKSFLRLQFVLKRIKRSQGSSKFTRLPITLTHLTLFQLLLSNPSFDNIMLWAALALAFLDFSESVNSHAQDGLIPTYTSHPKTSPSFPQNITPCTCKSISSVKN